MLQNAMNSKGFDEFGCPTGWPGLAGRPAEAGRPACWPGGQETGEGFFRGQAARRQDKIFLSRGLRPGDRTGLLFRQPDKGLVLPQNQYCPGQSPAPSNLLFSVKEIIPVCKLHFLKNMRFHGEYHFCEKLLFLKSRKL